MAQTNEENASPEIDKTNETQTDQKKQEVDNNKSTSKETEIDQKKQEGDEIVTNETEKNNKTKRESNKKEVKDVEDFDGPAKRTRRSTAERIQDFPNEPKTEV